MRARGRIRAREPDDLVLHRVEREGVAVVNMGEKFCVRLLVAGGFREVEAHESDSYNADPPLSVLTMLACVLQNGKTPCAPRSVFYTARWLQSGDHTFFLCSCSRNMSNDQPERLSALR